MKTLRTGNRRPDKPAPKARPGGKARPRPKRAPQPAAAPASDAASGTAKPLPRRHLQVYRAWCKRCGICVAFCPAGALAQDTEGHPCWAQAASCTNCGLCELRCPDFAIEVFDSGEEDRAAPV